MSRLNLWKLVSGGFFAILSVAAFSPFAEAQQARLYYFTSANCPPCRQMMPTIDRLSSQGFAVSKIDVGVQPKWAKHFNVTQTPTCVIVADNTIYGRNTGIISLDRLRRAMVETERLAKLDRTKKTNGHVRTVSAPANNRVPSTANRAQSTIAKTSYDAEIPTASHSQRLSPKQIAFRATVRLRVEDPEGISHGTGTIIDVRDGHALVLTCGHIFRESAGKGEISVDYGFGDSAQRSRGRLIQCDWDEKDVALVTMSIKKSIQPVPLAPASLQFQRGERAFSVGCSHGKDPTIKECQIKRVAMYGLANSKSNVRAKKIDTTVRPVDGRSGGGLFTTDGRLIGVCNAAATEIDEGIYSALENVYWQLKQARLTHIGSNSTNSRNRQAQRQTTQQNVWTIQAKAPDGRVYTVSNPSAELMRKIASESRRNINSSPQLQPRDMPVVRQSQLPNSQYRAQSPR